MCKVRFAAVLSDGTVMVEEEDLVTVPGEVRPWVKLTELLKDRTVEELKLLIDDEEVLMPFGFSRFGLVSEDPASYSLQYSTELEMDGGSFTTSNFVDLIAHFKDFEVHYIHDLEKKKGLIAVTKGLRPLVPVNH